MNTPSVHDARNLFAIVFIGVFISVAYVANPSFSFFKALKVQATTNENVSGWAWSETIGWISFNDTNEANPYSGTSYGVNVDTTNKATGGTGDFSGVAWSENIGWVSFNRIDTGTPPSAPFNGATGPIAQVDWSTGKVTGWARALSAIGSASGWDGWIKLSKDAADTGATYGVTISGDKFSGYGWGGNDGAGTAGVVGWVDFAPTVGGVPVGVQVSAPPCTVANVTSWGSCQALSQCVAPPATQSNVPGIRIGICAAGGTVSDTCTVPSQTCTAAGGAAGTCGDHVCGTGENFGNCPTDCRSSVQQF